MKNHRGRVGEHGCREWTGEAEKTARTRGEWKKGRSGLGHKEINGTVKMHKVVDFMSDNGIAVLE